MKKCLWILFATFMLLTGSLSGICSAASDTNARDREIISKIVDNMKLLAQVPRPSHHEKLISDFLVKWAEQQGFQAQQDKQNNIMFNVPATPGCEALPPVILQGHMDMVCVAAEGVKFDPLKDPIKVVRDDKAGTLTADGTSLGADDGAGVSMIMLAAKGEMKHGPLRVIITTDEEDGMEGAFGISPAWLADIRYCINLDNEESNQVLVSTAAGDSVKATGSVTMQKPVGDTTVKLEIKDLKGGHSGIEIDKGRCNGIIAMARTLKRIRDKGLEFELVSFDGGVASNAIPSKVNAILVIKGKDKGMLQTIVEDAGNELRKKYAGIEDNFRFVLTDVPAAEQAVSKQDRDRAILFMDQIVDGVNTWSKDMKGLVESSSNLGIFKLDKDGLTARTYVRSSVGKLEEKIVNSQLALAKKCGYKTERIKMADPWPYNPNSKLLALTKEAYKKLNGEDIKVVAVHAGLECGTFAKLNPELDLISIGPDLKDVHSPKETLYLNSIPKTWNLLQEILLQVK